MEFGYESMKHAGSLKWGGGGEGSYADFKSHQFNAVLRIDLDDAGSHAGREFGDGSDHSDHDAGSSGHATHFGHGGMAPAGVLFSHMLEHQGEWMLGYRYMYRRQAGDVMQGTHPVRDPATVAGACATDPCYIKPTSMNMHMHMLEAMVALSDSVTLMLMPQFVDMNMSMRPLDGSPPSPGMGDPVGAAIMHAGHPHTTGGIGDTELHALFALRRDLEREWILGLGLSAPTGDVGVKLRPVMGYKLGYIEYGLP